MIFCFGSYRIDVDVEKTRAFYDRAATITEGCKCSGCRNYEAWAKSLSEEPKGIMGEMGVRPEKPAEAFVNGENADGSMFYGGWYHLCGRILEGGSSCRNDLERDYQIDELCFEELGNGFRAAFTDHIALLEEGFPEPAIQMEIMADIPWLLNGEKYF
ncbi:MAG: hypothetical protein IJE08_13215 [Clostridia bacterium]|nr:hypothetical protein [Clostridia bacterium]